MPMTDIEKARHLFRKNRLTFPKIPEDLAARLKERGEWLFSTREIQFSPYHILHYLREMEEICVEDYAVLCYSGHGLYYAIQYYIVHGGLAMFLFLSWGGLHRSATADSFTIHQAFFMADKIVHAAQTTGRLRAGDRLTVVGSDYYIESYWSPPGESPREEVSGVRGLWQVLSEVYRWLTGTPMRPGYGC